MLFRSIVESEGVVTMLLRMWIITVRMTREAAGLVLLYWLCWFYWETSGGGDGGQSLEVLPVFMLVWSPRCCSFGCLMMVKKISGSIILGVETGIMNG